MSIDLSKLRHARSQKDFPEISLEENEYVVIKVKRSPVIPVLVWSGVGLVGVIIIALSILLTSSAGLASGIGKMSQAFLLLILMVVGGVVLIAALVSNSVYNANKLIVTNKRIMQMSKISLFSASTNIIDLVSIEDVSFKQNGLFEHLFKLGTLRMSTVGEETTYTFKHVDTPKDELDTITHLVHVAKSELEKKSRLALQ